MKRSRHHTFNSILLALGRILHRGINHWNVIRRVDDSSLREEGQLSGLIFNTASKQTRITIEALTLRCRFDAPTKFRCALRIVSQRYEQLLFAGLTSILVVEAKDAISADLFGIKRVRVFQRFSSARSCPAFRLSRPEQHSGHSQRNPRISSGSTCSRRPSTPSYRQVRRA